MARSPLTAAQQRRVQWKTIDGALAPFSTDSITVLLQAALASPGCSRVHDHLLLLWTRTLRTPARTGAAAAAADLPGLVEAAGRAAPGRGVVTDRVPSDVRGRVRFATRAGERLLVHPGQLAHPLLVLRSLQLTALAVDEPARAAVGFGLSNVLELALRLSDHTLIAVSPAWAAGALDEDPQVVCALAEDEVGAARLLAGADLDAVTAACGQPADAARALDWLTEAIEGLPLRYHPQAPLLGPVLAVTAHGRRVVVPACAATDALAPAAGRLLGALPASAVEAAEERLQDLVVSRTAQLLGMEEVPARPGRVCVLSAPADRYDIAIVSALAESALSARIEEARSVLGELATGRGRLVVYGGPRFLGPELIEDTVYLHTEELAEILADAEGDLAVLALFILELTEHPGVHGVFYRDVLDAWTAWRRETTLLPPGPYRDEVAAVSPAVHDVSWDRAAAWAATDEVLAAAELPEALHWRFARLDKPDPDPVGEQADLVYPTSTGQMIAHVSTLPPLVVLATVRPGPDTFLDPGTMTGLADALRTTLVTCPTVADHATLPDGAPIVIELTATAEPHQPPATAGVDAEPDGDPEAGERLLLHVGADPDRARIGVDIDPPLLAAFTGDGRQGHHIVGQVLHHLLDQIRQARGAGPGTDRETYLAEWDTAHPVLRLSGATNSWPATAPAYTLPRSPHLHARALRTAAAAVRRARIPASTWSGPQAYARGGPAEQLLHALEEMLAEEIRAHRPDLVDELARHLNAAWSSRTRGDAEAAANLTAPWAENWIEEAGRRQSDGANATSALQLLLQQAIATPPAGEKPVDTIAVAELVALAELVRHCGTTAVAAARRLHDLHLQIHPTGVFTLTDTPDPDTPDPDSADIQGTDAELAAHLGYDAHAYQSARQQHRITRAATADPEPLDAATVLAGPGIRTATEYTQADLPPRSHLAQADQLLRQHWNCGLAALGAVLATAADWPTGPQGTTAVTAEDLLREAAAWSNLPDEELIAATERLTLHPGNAASVGAHPYTEVERRTRPMTHPLITAGDRLLVLPWLVHAAQELYAGYIDEGRLPRPDVPDPVGKALLRHRQQLDELLESDLKEIAQRAGLPHRFRLLEKTAASLGIPGLTGEVDLLIADPDRGRLWVIEAKNPVPAVAPHAVLQHIQRFTTRYRDKLLAKTATIAAFPAQAAGACRAASEQPWQVLPLMVTRAVEPAAFVTDPRVPYTTADNLAHVLTAPGDPAPGWIPRRD
ncbi:hypothetical protein [Streptomyces sp. NBC_00829]|uniref:hypothetical protein n=1 Tax=Streptomyces sp. NBC_00829 TaxID=2903679 RepID=UPI002F908E92|nr:hypothetical protein OG293_41380 [Streptomyces sp. NBC_00829]